MKLFIKNANEKTKTMDHDLHHNLILVLVLQSKRIQMHRFICNITLLMYILYNDLYADLKYSHGNDHGAKECWTVALSVLAALGPR